MPQTPETDLDALLDEAEALLDAGDAEAALDTCEDILERDPDNVAATYLLAEAWRELGGIDNAIDAYRRTTQLLPAHAPAWSGLGEALFEALEFDEANSALQRAMREDSTYASPYYYRAMLRERRKDWLGARRDYRRAQRLDPEQFPEPLAFDDALAEAVVTEALRSLPEMVREALKNTPILLEDVPPVEVLAQYEPPAPPGEVLGVFSGMPIGWETPSPLPNTIILYRCNLARIAWDKERLLEELRITLFHEVGHFLGLTEADLEDRGLD